MSKFAVVATYDIAPEQIGAFIPLLKAHRDCCLKDEPGTLRFDILQPEHILMLNRTAAEQQSRVRPTAEQGQAEQGQAYTL
jgi:quinol monooxygenase YgiN